jgi:cell wall-associated NlpC family hydrolase
MKRIRIAIALWLSALLLACAPQQIRDARTENDRIQIVGQIEQPTPAPTETEAPTAAPTPEPTAAPTPEPTDAPTAEPTPEPTETPEPTATPEPDRTKAEAFCDAATALLDVPYQRGGTSAETGFDPGGFGYYCLNAAGVKVRHKTSKGYSEMTEWMRVDSTDDLEKGDLCFFRTPGNDAVNCVTIYLGDGRMIYPSSGEGKVITAKITTNYWKEAFVFARRVF